MLRLQFLRRIPSSLCQFGTHLGCIFGNVTFRERGCKREKVSELKKLFMRHLHLSLSKETNGDSNLGPIKCYMCLASLD